ncbi:MAG: hypothetical protein V4512_07725 [Pseudomonadota bacterium]|uniref:hypothetical protein n=1 Tax=Sphingobium sp. KCTC 72723 TaxID=2733867 RepID=UPI0021D187D1|nr:hypothetical protein [Sphingobium sp. KCTC 72723]
MAQTSEFCLAQQSIHNARAESSVLPNVRRIAQTAANAWGREASLAAGAERRRATRSVETEDMAIAAEFRAEDEAEAAALLAAH